MAFDKCTESSEEWFNVIDSETSSEQKLAKHANETKKEKSNHPSKKKKSEKTTESDKRSYVGLLNT